MTVHGWARRLSATAATTFTIVTGIATPAHAAGFNGGFAAGPVGAGASGYFSLTLAPGTRTRRSVQITNLKATAQALDLHAVRGVTSPSSGDVYVGRPGTCAGAGCWITGLPRRLRLGASRTQAVRFSVRVPAATPAGQYLGGVAVEPPSTPPATAGRGARSVIVHEVVIGVAVTVGSHYPSELSIPRVTGAAIGDGAGIAVAEANEGAQFEHPSGAATVMVNGASTSFPLRSQTVLPGGRATLRVLTAHVAPGTYSARVSLTYDGGAKRASWIGTVRIPVVAPVGTGAAGPSQQSSTPSLLLLAETGLGGALLAALTVGLLRRRRGHRAAREQL